MLIFERIREELRSGQERDRRGRCWLRQSLVDHRRHARDHGRIVRLPVPVREGPVRGFAVTLMIGLIANVFTAVFVSKTIFDYELSGRRQLDGAEHLNLGRSQVSRCAGTKCKRLVSNVMMQHRHGNGSMELFKNTNFDFLGKKWPFIIASLVLTVAGFASIADAGRAQVRHRFQGRHPDDGEVRRDASDREDPRALCQVGKIKGEVTVQNFTGSATQERGRDRHGAGRTSSS